MTGEPLTTVQARDYARRWAYYLADEPEALTNVERERLFAWVRDLVAGAAEASAAEVTPWFRTIMLTSVLDIDEPAARALWEVASRS